MNTKSISGMMARGAPPTRSGIYLFIRQNMPECHQNVKFFKEKNVRGTRG